MAYIRCGNGGGADLPNSVAFTLQGYSNDFKGHLVFPSEMIKDYTSVTFTATPANANVVFTIDGTTIAADTPTSLSGYSFNGDVKIQCNSTSLTTSVFTATFTK